MFHYLLDRGLGVGGQKLEHLRCDDEALVAGGLARDGDGQGKDGEEDLHVDAVVVVV